MSAVKIVVIVAITVLTLYFGADVLHAVGAVFGWLFNHPMIGAPVFVTAFIMVPMCIASDA